MKRFVIVKTPSEGYMRKQKMFFTGIEKTDPKSVCRRRRNQKRAEHFLLV